jgi:hypothetical protein
MKNGKKRVSNEEVKRTGELEKQPKQELQKLEPRPSSAVTFDNPWLQAAAEAGGSDLGRLLKFVKGRWCVGDDEVSQGSEFIAHLDQLARGWVRFEDGAVTDLKLVKIADGVKLPEREALPDLDQKKWEQDDNGEPRDPWTLQWYLPLIGVETGDFVTYVTNSAGGNGAIASLCRVYGNRQRDGLLPIIALKARSYKHRQYGRVEVPDLPIVGWHGRATTKTVATVQPKQTAAAEMNDEIPF